MSEKSLFEKVKEAASHTIIYGVGSALQSVLGFILIPLYTKYYTPDIYGTLAILNICGSLAGVVFYMGVSSALSRSYYDYADSYERKKVISTSLYLSLLGALAQTLFALSFRKTISFRLFDTDVYSMHVFIVLVSSALTFLNNLFYILLRFERKSKQVVIINLLSLIMSATLITTLLVYFRLGIMAPILGQFIGQAILFLILFALTKSSFVFAYLRHEVKVQLQFGIPTVLAGLGQYLLNSIDRFVMNRYSTLENVGIYSLGFLIGSSINTLFILPFCQIWAPMRMEYRHDSNARELYKLILTYYFIVGLSFALVVSLFCQEIIMVLSRREDYLAAYKVIPIIIFSFLIYGAINIIDNGIYFSRKIIYHTCIFWFCVVINFLLNYFFIPLFGYMAAAVNLLITFAVNVILVFIISNRLYKFDVEIIRLAKIFVSGLLVLILGTFFIKTGNILNSVLLKFMLLTLLFTYWFIFVLTGGEKVKILSFFNIEKNKRWIN